MPVIQVRLIEEIFTPAQKNEIIARLTDAMAAVEGYNMRTATWVIIEDVCSGDLWHAGSRIEDPGSCVAQS